MVTGNITNTKSCPYISPPVYKPPPMYKPRAYIRRFTVWKAKSNILSPFTSLLHLKLSVCSLVIYLYRLLPLHLSHCPPTSSNSSPQTYLHSYCALCLLSCDQKSSCVLRFVTMTLRSHAQLLSSLKIFQSSCWTLNQSCHSFGYYHHKRILKYIYIYIYVKKCDLIR